MDDLKLHTLHAGVKDFLHYFRYEESLTAYQNELKKHDTNCQSELPPLPGDAEISKAKEELMQSFLQGNQEQFWLLWNEHIPESWRRKSDTQRLEFKLHLYFAVYSMINDGYRDSGVESSMQMFKTYLETKGGVLSETSEFVAFYALPFVPNPKTHLTFKTLFEDAWKDELTENVAIFLQNCLDLDSAPYLYRLLPRSDQHSVLQQNLKVQSGEIESLKIKLTKHENKGKEKSKKLTKLQNDYHNLIGIAVELVDSLETCVRGKMITPDHLQQLYGRLFGSTFEKPGSAASMLRASIQSLR